MFGSKPIVGLDIGSDKVKAIQIKQKGSSIELEKMGIAEVYPNGDRGAGDPRELRVAACKRALDNGRITAKHCVSAVSGESIIVRYIQLPPMSEQELANALRWEAEEYIPFHIDEVNLDHVVLGNSPDGKIDVLLVCAKKDLVNDHVGIIRSLGLTPAIVDVDSFAFLNAYESAYKPSAQDCTALVNIGAEITNINIYVGNTSRFSRDINVAGNALTQAIMQKCGVNFAKAEELKAALGAPQPEKTEDTEEEESSLISSIRGTVERMTGSDLAEEGLEGGAAKAIRTVLTSMVGELRRSIQFFENQGGGTAVQRVVLGGGTSRMPNLTAYLARELELDVQLFDPLRGIDIGSGVDQSTLQTSREHLGVGIGLALRKAG